MLDLDRPLGVLFIAVMPFIDDADRPAALIAEFMSATAPGSHLAISHPLRSDHPASRVATVYNQSRSPNPMRFRTREEIRALFVDLTLVDPGLVLMPLWRPEPADDGEAPDVDPDYPGLAGLGRRD